MVKTYKAAALIAEFVGSFMLASVVLAMLDKSQPLYATVLMAGAALTLVALTVGRVSGTHINPAVTIGLWTIRRVDTVRAVAYIFVQLLGGLAAMYVAQQVLGHDLVRRAAQPVDWVVVFAEALGAALFMIGFASAVYRGYRGAVAALTVGGSFALGLIVASMGSAAIINPAVALSVNAFSLSYIVGPILGAVAGANLYALVFAPLDSAERRHAMLANSAGRVASSHATHAHAATKKASAKKSVAKPVTRRKTVAAKTAKKSTKR
ncbi:hypothetical protein CR970_01595 [Candidatus Saccharibacteria bacterium]|nr:MAG: hypothetical protein CR970_01595 [Candidatus Saccharibacteria bacterium]